MFKISKKIIIISILLLVFLSACMNETRTFPESVSFGNEVTVIKINPDKIPIASKPTIYENKIYYHGAPKTLTEPDIKYYVYDISSEKTSTSTKKDFDFAQENTKQRRIFPTKLNEFPFIYEFDGEEINISDRKSGITYVTYENYLVWVEEYSTDSDLMYIINLNNKSIREIKPHEDLITDMEHMGTFFKPSSFTIRDNSLLIAGSGCIYQYDLNTLESKKVFCDDNYFGSMNFFENMIVLTGNDAHRLESNENRIHQNSFLILI